jgi:hypothetical protein
VEEVLLRLFLSLREIARKYLDRYPLDEKDQAHVQMMRLEVEAEKPRAGE